MIPDEPRYDSPNSLDRYCRDKFWSGTDKQDQARTWSERLIYGVSMSSLAWGPALSESSKLSLHINARVFAVNSLLTNVVKITVARERPYHHFGTREGEGPRDFTSFYSGHSSVAFSQAVTNAMMLSRNYPEHKSAIWSSLLGSAGLTAYLRMAGDMHYFTDILTGAVMGSLVAWTLTKYELNRFEKESNDSNVLLKNQEGVSNFMLSVKIPLG